MTVRTLHHYDRLGLLRPQHYTAQGYRLYGEPAFARLQQIVTLKFIGFPLSQIKEILGPREVDLATTLQMQRRAIVAQKRRLDIALAAIDQAEQARQTDGATDWEAFRKIIEVIDMEKNAEWTKQYYSEEAQAKVEERKQLWSPELQERVTRDWSELTADIETAMAEGALPAAERGQQLAERWRGLLRQFTGGDPGIQAGLNKMYADEANWKTEWKKPFSDEVQQFIYAAMKPGA